MAPSALFRTPSDRTPSDRDVVIPTEQEQSSGGGLSGSRSRGSMFERRRRRKNKVDASRSDLSSSGMTPTQSQSNSAMSREKRRQQRKQKKTEDDIDPYDSDPGQSYREHCKQNRGFSTKSCLAVPKFLNKSGGREEQSVLTAPPSPLQSEMGDLGQAPASLPPSLTRVRYSLRSSITDGAEPQPLGPTVMERRDLRPNNVQMNVSHWSEEGGRPYMEDRYVFSSVVGIDWGLFVLLERIILG